MNLVVEVSLRPRQGRPQVGLHREGIGEAHYAPRPVREQAGRSGPAPFLGDGLSRQQAGAPQPRRRHSALILCEGRVALAHRMGEVGRGRVRAALDGVNLAVEAADVDADVAEVIGEFLGGALGEGGLKSAPSGQRKIAQGTRATASAALGKLSNKSPKP